MTQKFGVVRHDGADHPGGKHDGCQYLVLDLTHDEAARAAALAYGAVRLTSIGLMPPDEEDREWLLLLIEQIRALPPVPSPGGAGGPTRRSGPSSTG